MSYNEKQSVTPAPEDHQVQLEQDYREVGEKYGEDFLKKYNRDLNKTLIFVSSAWSFDEHALIRMGRLVCSRLSLLPSPSRLTPKCNLTQATRPPLSSGSSYTRSTTLLSEAMFPPSHNGPGLLPQWFMPRPSSTRVLPLRS